VIVSGIDTVRLIEFLKAKINLTGVRMPLCSSVFESSIYQLRGGRIDQRIIEVSTHDVVRGSKYSELVIHSR
jgi:hypothetical protein